MEEETLTNTKDIQEVAEQLAYSLKEACQITGLCRTTLWKAIKTRRLGCYKVGRRVLVSRRHLQDYLALHEFSNQRSSVKSGDLNMVRKRSGRR